MRASDYDKSIEIVSEKASLILQIQSDHYSSNNISASHQSNITMATAATMTQPTVQREFNVKPVLDAKTVHAIPPCVVHDTPVLNVLDESVHYGDWRDGKF